MMTRKAIHTTVASNLNSGHMIVLATADDGTIWFKSLTAMGEWEQLRNLPQPKVK